jgi:hypothetical protein
MALAWQEMRVASPPPKPKADTYIGHPDGRIASALTFNEIVERQARKRREAR